MRKMRPCAPDESSRHAADAAAKDCGEGWLEIAASVPWRARERSWLFAIDDLERGDNCPSLAARGALELHPKVSLHKLLSVSARIVAEDQVVLCGLIHGGRQDGIDFSSGRVFCGEGCVSAMPAQKV